MFAFFRTEFNPDNQQHEQYAHNMLSAFLQELDSKANSFVTEDLFLSKLKLEEASRNFRVSSQYQFLYVEKLHDIESNQYACVLDNCVYKESW